MAPTVMNSSLLDRGNTASFAKTASVKGFGRRPIAAVGQTPGPSSESPQGRNPRGVEVGKAPRAMAI
jgi:hypothetical protein